MTAAIVFLVLLSVVAIFIFKDNKEETDHKTDNQPSSSRLGHKEMMDIVNKVGRDGYGNYWQGFKVRKPQDSKAIESLCGRNMDTLSDADAFQIVSSFTRWSKNTGTPIADLKGNFIEQMESLMAAGATFDMLIDRMKTEKFKEAKQFNISEDFTICSFMYEWLIEMKNEQEKKVMAERIAKNLNIPQQKMDSIKEEIEKVEKEMRLAPDISHLDREENRLFNLAKDGVKSLSEISTISEDNTYRLDENGKLEARILCSTIVIDLHSHFKNEIDLDVQADRYFLLLFDSMTGDCPDDLIGFLNSRIAFYNDSIKMIKEEPFSKATRSIIAKIFDLLYLNPLSTTFENDFQTETVSSDASLALTIKLEDVIKDMEVGRLLITSEEAQEISQKFQLILKNLVPESKRKLLNQDVVSLFASQVIDMIKTGGADDKITSLMPRNVIQLIKELRGICNDSVDLSVEQIDNILNNAKDEYVKTFEK